MKSVSVRAPWWLFLVRGWKPVENRSRVDGREPAIVRHRGPLLIHASSWHDDEEIVDAVGTVLPSGRIVGMRAGAPVPGRIVDWHAPESFGLVVAGAAEVPRVPARGALGLFDVPIDPVSAPGQAVAAWQARRAERDTELLRETTSTRFASATAMGGQHG